MSQVIRNIQNLFNVCVNKVGLSKRKIWFFLFVEVLRKFWDLLPTFCYYILLHIVIKKSNIEFLKPVLFLYGVVFLGQMAIGKIEVNVKNITNAKLLSSLRNIVMEKLMNKEIGEVISKEADLKYIVHDDSEQIADFFSQSIGFLCNVVSFLITAIVILILQWKLALICFAVIPISFWITQKINKKSYSGYEKQRSLDVEYSQFSEEVFCNWTDIRINGIENYEKRQFAKIWEQIGENNFKVHLFWFFNRTLITFKDVFATKILIYLLGGILIVYSQFDIAALIVFVDYYMRLMNDLFALVDNIVMMQRKQVSLIKWTEFVNGEEVPSVNVVGRDITFDHVSFSYDSRKLIENLNLSVEQGEIVGIFGKSGMGKSTIIQLLLNVIQPQSGDIFLGDKKLNDVRVDTLFSTIGFMMQDALVFDMSIFENIRLGNYGVTEEQVRVVLRKLKFDIDKFPDGLATRVGQNGQVLSGGERQKMIIARTLLRDVQVVVMDEPSSALDSDSRKAFYEYIVGYKQKKSLIMVSHDMEAQKVCDKCVHFMNDGEIEVG